MTENQKKLLETLQTIDSCEKKIEEGIDVDLSTRILSVMWIGYKDLINKEQ